MFKVKDGIRIGAQEFVNSSRNVTAGTITASDVTISGALYGPATMYIDPAGIGDNTGTLVIRGNLQVDGTTTTINSTTVAIDDLNLQLASDAPNAAAANGAGITIGGASATLTYTSVDDRWNFNKGLNVNGSTVWHAGNLTNLNQLTNGPGYITGYTETDTLASVTARGASTGTAVTLSSGNNRYQGHFFYDPYDASGNHYPHFTDGGSASGVKVNWRLFTGATNSVTHLWRTDYTYFANRVESASDMRATLFYDASDTSFYVDPASTSRIRKTNLIASGSGWDDGLNIYSSDATNRWNFLVDEGASDALRIAYNNSEAINVNTSRNVTIAVDIRSPVFYDSNDTAYYVDPNSTSNLWALKLNRTADHQLQVARIRGLNTDRTGDYIHMYERVHIGYPSGWGGVDAPSYGLSVWGNITAAQSNYVATWGYPAISTNSGWGGAAYPTIGSTGGTSGSLIMLHNPHIPFRTDNARSGASGRAGIRLAIDTGGSGYWDVGLTGDDFEIFRSSSSTQEFRVDNAGNSYSRVSSRAPIFYDSNDTSYYLDPNSGTSLVVAGIVKTNADRLVLRDDSIELHATDNDSAGIAVNYYGYAGGATRFRDFNVYDGKGNLRFKTYGSDNYAYSPSSFRAPIFYDSNDTNYYADPASTSVINTLTVSTINNIKPKTDVWHQSNEGKERFYFAPNSTTYYRTGNNFVFRNNSDSGVVTIDGSGNLRTTTGGDNYASYSLHVGGTGYAANDFRAPIFYDSNDTNFYLDPNADLSFNTSGYIRSYRNDVQAILQSQNTSAGSPAQFNLRHSYGDVVIENYRGGLFLNASAVQANNSLRAPVFYDSNDTNYYADPNSNSRFVNLGLGGATPDVRLSISGDEHLSGILYIGGTAGSVNSWASRDYTSGSSRYFNASAYEFNNYGYGSTWNFYLTSSYAWHTSSVRAPIFYDSNDTNFYADPASTSRFNRLETTVTSVHGAKRSYYVGNLTASANQARRFEIARIYIDYNDWHNAGIFQVELHGNYFFGGDYQLWNISYDYNNVSCNLISGDSPRGRYGQVTCSSPVQISGDYYYISVYVDVRHYAYYYGIVHTSWPETTTHQADSGVVLVYTSPSASNISDFTPTNTITTTNIISSTADIRAPIFYDSNDTGYYFDGASTTRTNIIQTNYIGVNQAYDPSWRLIVNGNAYLNSGGYGQAEGSWRAPTFYDSNDTAFYLNPRHESRLSGLRLDGIDNQASGTDAILWINKPNNNDWAMIVSGNLEYGINLQMASSHSYALTAQANGSEYSRLGSDLFYHNNQIRAPIFYDSNNTGYYLDPNSTTSLRTVGDWRSDSSSWTGEWTGKIQYHSNHWYFQSADLWIWRNAGGNNVIYGNQSGEFTATGNLRSPIFYDSNDTGYYANPNSSSQFSSLNCNGDFKTNFISGGGGHSFSSSHYSMGKDYANGGWSHPHYSDLIIGYHTGVRIGGAYSGIRFYNNSPTTDANNDGNGDGGEALLMTVGGYVGNSGNDVYVNYILYAGSSMRAPIFYDLNDTSYYLDPASTTTSLQVAGTIEQGNRYAHPNIDWGASGDSTGMVIFYVPGTTSNYGMVHMVFDIYEYNSPRTATVIVGGHNWNGGWYSTACNVVGFTDKQVRLGVKDGRYVVVFGTSGSSWSYGQIRLRKIQNGSYYDNNMDLGGNWSTTQTTTESFSNISSDLRNFRTPAALQVDGIIYGYSDIRTPIFYDQNDTNYYCDPNGSSRLNDVFPNNIYNYGWFRNQSSGNGLYNTANDAHFYSAGPNYWHINPDNGSVSVGGLIFYDQYTSTQNSSTGRKGSVYWDSAGFGLLDSTGNWSVNIHPTNYARVTIGGYNGINPYDGVTGIRLMFGGGSNDAADNYYIGTNLENFGGTYNKLDIRWHTGIRMGAQPNYGGVRIYDSEDMGTIRFSVNKGDANTRVETGDFYAANLYDRDNTSYYIDPPGTNRVNVVHANYFLGEITDSGSGDSNAPFRFESDYSGWVSLLANTPGAGNGWGTFWAGNDNPAYRFFDTSNPNEYVFVGAGVARASIDLDNGQSWFDTSIRSPIFYDSNDTGYYIDPNSTSNSALRMRGGALFGPNVTWGASLYVGTDGRPGTSAAVAVTNGNLHLDSQNGYQMYLNWYSGEPTWTGGNLGVGSSSASHRLHVHGTGLATSDFRAPIFYDSDNTGYYVDPGSNANIAGQVYIGGWFRNYGAAGLYNESYGNHWYATGNDYWNLAGNNTSNVGIMFRTGGHQGSVRGYVYADSSNNIGFLNSGGSWRLRVVGDDYSLADGSSMRAQIFYDSNDTTYYADFASSSTSVNTRGAIVSGGSGSTGGGLITINGNLGSLSLHPAAGSSAAEIRTSSSLLIKANTVTTVASISTSGIVSSGSITAFGSPSDRNLKENIVPLTNSLEKVRALQGVSFNWKKDTQEHTITGLDSDIGLIAQNVQEIFPELVRDQDGTLTLRERGLIAVLVEAVKEQDVKIKQLEALVETLVSKLGR